MDANNDNTKASKFLITISANGRQQTFTESVNKTSLEQTFVLDRERNVSNFLIFAKQLVVLIQVVDIYDQVSTVVEHTSVTYTTPLDTPVISVTKEILGYSVSWNNQTGKPFDQIYVYEDTGSGYQESGRGTSNPIRIPASGAQRYVKAKFVDINGESTGFSNIVSVTPDSAVDLNDEPPNPPGTVTGSAGIDNSGAIGFNGFLNISWVAGSGTNIRGYRIRFRPYKSTAPYQTWSYVDSPGSATSYRLTGLAVGTTYEVQVGSYNEFNRESISYSSLSGNLTVSGTPFIGTNVTTSGYFAANSGNDVGEFKFGYGVDTGKRGLVFNSSNYWYIDSSQNASFKLGGDANNYIQWDGQAFVVQGDIRAKKGNFSGHVQMATGGSIYSGTLNQAQTGITGAGYILNNTGLKFNSASIPDITTIDGTTGKLTTELASIGQWDVNSTTISKNGITLNSAGSIIANKDAYYIGIKPSASVNDIVLWAGQSSSGGTTASGPNFRVTSGGTLYATGAVISGDITLTTGSGLDNILSGKANIYRQAAKPTGGTYKSGDLWVDTDDSNKVYAWNTDITPADWTVIQNSAAALAAANAADIKAQEAKDKARKFDSLTGNLIDGVILSQNTASIYSPSNKSSYTSTNTGYFLGWYNYSANNWAPAINIGGADTYLKYDTYNDKLQVKGRIEATEGLFSGNVTAGGGAITIGPNGISTSSGKFSIDTSGNATFGGTLNANQITAGTFSGDRISGGVIIGSTIKTNASGYLGILQLNSSDNSLEFLNSAGTSTLGKIYSFNSGSELILQNGGTQYLGYPTNTSYMSLNSISVRLGLIGNNAVATDTLTIDASGATFNGGYVRNETSNSLTWASMRNISAWSGIAPDANTNLGTTFTGDIYIQY